MLGRGKEFEALIEATFKGYEEKGIARLMVMPVPTRATGMTKTRPRLVYDGKGPWDVVGYSLGDATMIGAELKSTQWKDRIPIVAPDSKGDGVQFHQLDALAGLAMTGGCARLVWENDGEIRIMRGGAIVAHWRSYVEAFKSKRSGKTVPRGSMSLPWDEFEKIEGLDWLSPK